DHLADSLTDDALRRVEALVRHDVGHEDALLLVQDIFHDRVRDGKLLCRRRWADAPAYRLGREAARIGIAHQDTAAVGLQGAKHQFQDAIEQIAEVGDVADRLAQFVEDAEVGQQLVGERALDFFGVGEDAAALALADALDDGAGQLNVLARDQTDLLGKVDEAGVVYPSAVADAHALA